MRFSRSAGVIPGDPDAPYVVNLLFLAEPENPIWTTTPHVTTATGSVNVEGAALVQGSETPHGILGNLQVTVRAKQPGLLQSVTVSAPGGPSVDVAIGHWEVVQPRPQLDFMSPEYPVSAPGCDIVADADPIRVSLKAPGSAPPTVQSLTPGVTLSATADTDVLTVSMSCTDEWDVYAVQPEVVVDGSRRWLPQILIGMMGIDDSLVRKIASRPAVRYPA